MAEFIFYLAVYYVAVIVMVITKRDCCIPYYDTHAARYCDIHNPLARSMCFIRWLHKDLRKIGIKKSSSSLIWHQCINNRTIKQDVSRIITGTTYGKGYLLSDVCLDVIKSFHDWNCRYFRSCSELLTLNLLISITKYTRHAFLALITIYI